MKMGSLKSKNYGLKEFRKLNEQFLAGKNVANDLIRIAKVVILLTQPADPPLEQGLVSGVNPIHAGIFNRNRLLGQNEEQV